LPDEASYFFAQVILRFGRLGEPTRDEAVTKNKDSGH
jgi:hypothetical protein